MNTPNPPIAKSVIRLTPEFAPIRILLVRAEGGGFIVSTNVNGQTLRTWEHSGYDEAMQTYLTLLDNFLSDGLPL